MTRAHLNTYGSTHVQQPVPQQKTLKGYDIRDRSAAVTSPGNSYYVL